MSSPRSMWSGTLRLGLLTVPITLAKATSEQREKALVTVCEHGVPINRSERCGAGEETCTLSKSKAVQVGEDEYRTLEPNEYHPRHYHSRGSEFYYVLEGSCLVTVDDEIVEATPGTAFYLPEGTVHSVRTRENESVSLLYGFDEGISENISVTWLE